MLSRRSLLATSLTGLAAGTAAAPPEVIAETQYGKVRGAVIDRVATFKGIRYGASTAGMRFRAPRTPAPWADVRDALDFAPMCPQVIVSLPSIFASWTFEKAMS